MVPLLRAAARRVAPRVAAGELDEHMLTPLDGAPERAYAARPSAFHAPRAGLLPHQCGIAALRCFYQIAALPTTRSR